MSSAFRMTLVLVLIVFVTTAYSDDISDPDGLSGRYSLNTNNSIGYLDITVTGNQVTGEMVWFIDRNGDAVSENAQITNGMIVRDDNNTIYIYFQRVGNPQEYHGYFSYDKKFIAGYFEKGYKIPWYAKRQ